MAKWLKPQFWLYLMPLIWPLYLIKFDVKGLPFNFLEVAILGLFVWQLIVWIVEKRKFKLDMVFVTLSALFLAAGIAGVLIVPSTQILADGNTVFEAKKIALGIFKGWLVVPYLYLLMLWYSAKCQKDLFNSLYAYLFSILPLAIWAFYQYISGDFITADGRASGPFINANYLAMYMTPGVAALWVLIVRGVLFGFKPIRFLIGMALAILYTITLLMTQSYAAIGAVIMSLLIFFAYSWHLLKKFDKKYEFKVLKKIGTMLLVFAGIALVAAFALFVNTEKWKLFTEFKERSSSSVRLQLYQVAFEEIKRNPIFGLGLGQFQARYDLDSKEILGHQPYELIMLHPHNTFLAFYLNLGLIGVLLFAFWAAKMLFSVWSAEGFEQKYFRLIGVTMFVVMLLHGMVDTYFFKNDLAVLFWLMFALCLLPMPANETSNK